MFWLLLFVETRATRGGAELVWMKRGPGRLRRQFKLRV
jgi:hypothetical protein